MNKFMVNVCVDIRKLVSADRRADSSASGECAICASYGWVNRYRWGLPYSDKSDGHYLTHEEDCPVGQLLDCTGKLKKKKRWYEVCYNDRLDNDTSDRRGFHALNDADAETKARQLLEDMNKEIKCPGNYTFEQLEEVVQDKETRIVVARK